ncbi:MAG: DedA family protein [Burkholderiales bacterium]|nr:DedA family protein [Burkholderiales bacterium]MCJ7837945.1 DedA family protein [Burkholderiales bacterium]
MELLLFFWDLLVHLDKHLASLLQQYGVWVYLLLFLIVFCETGLVVTPFLPGDSLLFVAGTLWAAAGLNVHALAALLIFAAILGNTTNYWIGRYLGPKVFHWEDSRWFNRKALDRTHEFYERHGGKTIVITRFVPIIRTFAPFVAGVGSMTHGRFQLFNIAGGVLWVASLLYAGFFFGNIGFIRNNLTLVIFGIIGLSLAPIALEYARHRLRRTQASEAK